MKRTLILAFTFAVAAAMSACSGMLEAENENHVEYGNHYNTFNDADNAILGIYGKLMGLADRVIILNELRADLIEFTPSATPDMVDISNHTVTASNSYCDLAPFYEVILNCNDALDNFNKMRAENKLSAADYSYRYADVATVRCWVYLQLAIHFGRIPYVTNPLVTVNDLKNEGNFPVKDFDGIISELIACMESLPTTELSTSSPLFNAVIDGYYMPLLFLNKKAVLGDLYLWANRYRDAATAYYGVIEEAENKLAMGGTQHAYKVDGWVWNRGNDQPEFQVCYERYKASDMSTFRNAWKDMFYFSSTSSQLRREMITMWSYNPRFAPRNPLIELFAPTGMGKYQLKPTIYIMDTLWEKQVQRENNAEFDGRGRQSSFDYVNGEPVVLKYLYNYYSSTTDQNSTRQLNYYDIPNPYALEGSWFVYRAALLHLRYAEAANREGYTDIAHALLNNGIQDNYTWDNRADVTGIQYTGTRPDTTTVASEPYPRPFFLDARNSGTSTQFEYFRQPWRDNYGIRRRAWVQNVNVGALPTKQDSVLAMEQLLLREAALECAFEGHRWSDLLRIAMRKDREDGSGEAFLNEQLRRGKPNLRPLTRQEWFLPTRFVNNE